MSPITWKPWTVKHIDTESGEQFHILPDADSRIHQLSIVCACAPQYAGERETRGGRVLPLFLHKSWDSRELDEWYYFNILHPELGKTDQNYEY